jgi:hypothetical protein
MLKKGVDQLVGCSQPPRMSNKSLYENVAANKIAREWLTFADSCIARGLNPAKLSDTSKGAASGEWEPNGLLAEYKYSTASRDRIAASAVHQARERLQAGEYPTVLKFFSTVR